MKGKLMSLPYCSGRGRSTRRVLLALCAFWLVGGCLLAPTICPAAETQAIQVVARDPAGHGLLCKTEEKTILIVAGTPQQMGTAHGTLLRQKANKLVDRVLYLVGGWRVWKTWTVEVAAPGADVLTFHWSHAIRPAAGD